MKRSEKMINFAFKTVFAADNDPKHIDNYLYIRY